MSVARKIRQALYQTVLIGSLSASAYAWEIDTKTVPENHSVSFFEGVQNQTLKKSLQTLEAWQYDFGRVFDDSVDGLDRWLGGSDEEVKRKQSRLILYFPNTFYENGSVHHLKFRASIDLPRSKNRWQLMLSSFDETSIDSPDNRTPGTTLKPFEQQNVNDPANSEASISLQRILHQGDHQLLTFRLGMKFQGITNPNPYGRLSHQITQHFDHSNVTSQTDNNLILEHIRGFVLESRQSFNLPDAKGNLYCSQTTGTWLKEDEQYLINQRFTKFDKILPHRYYAYFLDANWRLDKDVKQLESYAVGFNWREKLYKDWLYAELEPRITWYEEQDFNQANPSLMFMLEMHFYH